MAIEVKSTKNSVKDQGFNILVIASSGLGKTSLAKSAGKTIVISAEKSDLTLNDCDIDSIFVSNLRELKEAYLYVEKNKEKYDSVVMDSVTEVGEMIVTELKKDPEFASMKDGIKMWMKFSEIMLAIAKSFRDLKGINVIILALPETVKNGFDDKILPMIPAKKVQAKLQSLYDIVVQIKSDEDGTRNFICSTTGDFDAKDRSDKLEPTYEYKKNEGLNPIFKAILGKEYKNNCK